MRRFSLPLKTGLALSAAASALIGLAGPAVAETAGAPAPATASPLPRTQLAAAASRSAPTPTLAGGPAATAAPRAAPLTGQTVRVDLSGPTQTRMLTLPRGKSAVIELPVDARDVLVSDPKVADVVLSTPRRIYVLGVGAGQTDAAFFDAQGRQLLSLNVRVDQDITSLGETLNRVLPGGQVKVEAMGENLILSGQVANAADADKAFRLAAGLVAKPEQVINMLSIAGPEQVMLKVKIVEVSRTIIKQLGFNTNVVFNNGLQTYGFGQGATYGVNGSLLGTAQACAGQTGARTTNFNNSNTSSGSTTSSVSGGTNNSFTDTNITQGLNGSSSNSTNGFSSANSSSNTLASSFANAATSAFSRVTGTNTLGCLEAFERVGLVRTLAEPNLTAVSGESAKFLAGGEFPVPTARDNNGQVTVAFKPFGVGLGFTPVVLGAGRISLRVSTEVSELSNQGAFSIGAGNSTLTIPSLSVRRAETMVELPSGGGMMIAGLLQSKAKETLDSLPGLMQLPVLGALFRSRDFLNDETELVVIVTPYLVKSTDPDKLQTPADGLQLASDLQTNLLGRLNRAYGRSPAKTPEAAQGYQGPYGYVVD